MPSHRRRAAATSSGVHHLSDDRVITGLVDAADLAEDDLVIDFGAGPGTITAPLARTGARVLAVERDPRFVDTLRRRFATVPRVSVVHEDLRTVRLPRRAFTVVANIPFAVSTPLLRRLLTPVNGGFSRAELVVEWGLAKRLTTTHHRDFEAAWWSCRYTMTVRRRIPARCFSPAPRVDAAHLGVRQRGLDRRTLAILWTLLSAAYERPRLPARTALNGRAPRRVTHRLLSEHSASGVHTGQWLMLAKTLALDQNVVPARRFR
ncbi:rRNA adenine N(6)-methyltransferase family protein [Actinophytocola oryzae]|uniref:23S rRNA (Adenine-N6)-dimethyltransferase n=1 Tax=Actinophytocola oryzae TaxID=502181 RepID=A0A4R7UUU0_9PSEU|nr:rRNA adenine N(6)-methyltransferase family protein [Actinophytocola oryzae]TDV40473.1 23S rRNA (adenine-N6)-dimethyltransferase [Actinophytocola oryzae]